MKMLYASIRIVLVIAALVAVGLTPSAAAAEGKQLPYSASGPEVVIQEAPHPDCGAGRLKVEIEGSGQGTHIGKLTSLANIVLTSLLQLLKMVTLNKQPPMVTNYGVPITATLQAFSSLTKTGTRS